MQKTINKLKKSYLHFDETGFGKDENNGYI